MLRKTSLERIDYGPIQISENCRDKLENLPLEGDDAIQVIADIGGKVSGKSWDAWLLALQWIKRYGERARLLTLRLHANHLEGYISTGLDICRKFYGPKIASQMYNASDNVFYFPNGAFMQLGGIAERKEHVRYQGRNWNFLTVDEYPECDPAFIRKVRKELRGPEGMKPRTLYIGNPGGTYHSQMIRELCAHGPWTPFVEPDTGLRAIWLDSNFTMNPFIDQAEARRNIEAIRKDDPELADALLTGDPFIITGGDFFGGAWSEERIVLDPLTRAILDTIPGSFFLVGDHGGGSSPTWFGFFIMVEDPFYLQGRKIARGSLILFDEVHDAVPGAPNDVIRGSSILKNCELIVEKCRRWNVPPHGFVDPQVSQNHGDDSKLMDTYRQYGVRLRDWSKKTISGKPGTFRIEGASLVREYMHNAGSENYPGLYITRNCEYALDTVPYLQRDERRRDDVDSSGPDHAYDALKEAVRFVKKSWTRTELRR